MKSLRGWALCLCNLLAASLLFGQSQYPTPVAVRPTGVPGAESSPTIRRARPVHEADATAKPKKARAVASSDGDAATVTPKPKKARAVASSDDDEEATPKPKKKRARAKQPAGEEMWAAPPRPGGGIPSTHAKSILVIDANTGQTLYEKNADEIRAAASTQKLLTGLIIAEHGGLDRRVTVERSDTFCEPVRLNVKPGETYQRIELLRALLVKSPNDVARVLARDHAGSVEAFAAIMNQKARQLGAAHSNFINPNGLPVPGQYSTARDLALIAKAAYANPTIRQIVSMPHYVFRFSNGRTRELENTNKLLRQMPNCNGMKTGYTEAAGRCLISSAARPGREVIAVVLGDTSSRIWRDSSALLQWALWM